MLILNYSIPDVKIQEVTCDLDFIYLYKNNIFNILKYIKKIKPKTKLNYILVQNFTEKIVKGKKVS